MLETKKGPEVDQFKVTKDQGFKNTLHDTNSKWRQSNIVQKEGKEYVQLNPPLPGYTGFGKRVLANNIFGKTFAECRNDSLVDADKLDHEKKKNFKQQLDSEPPLKF